MSSKVFVFYRKKGKNYKDRLSACSKRYLELTKTLLKKIRFTFSRLGGNLEIVMYNLKLSLEWFMGYWWL